MVQDVERDEAKFTFGEKEDVHSVSNILKQCQSLLRQFLLHPLINTCAHVADLRELPDPVFPLPHPERVKHTKERGQYLSCGLHGGRD